MSWNFCALTGEPIENPVVSKLTGHIFEKRIIEKQIEATGCCPITNQPLKMEDLVDVKINQVTKPRPVQANSIPNMITIFQNEWDSLMLETYNLKQQLEIVRQELSHALYQHDAACRVIARLIKERDESRKELAELYDRLKSKEENEMQVEKVLLPKAIVESVQELTIKLTQQRKDRKKDAKYQNQFTPIEAVANFVKKDSLTLHSTTKPGITCMDIHPELELVATGGIDGHVILYDYDQSKVIQSFEKHSKRVNEVAFAHYDENIRIVSCSEDCTVNAFCHNLENSQNDIFYTYNDNQQPIVGLTAHPLGYLFAAANQDGCFSIHNLLENKCIAKISEFKDELDFSSVKIHPDGHFMTFGCTDGQLFVWNISQGEKLAQFSDDSCKSNQSSLCFSENGFILASASKTESIVQIWDLRSSDCIQKLFYTQDPKEKFSVSSIKFDQSSKILAVGGQRQVKLFDTKTWNILTTFDSHKDEVTGVNFGKKTKYLASCSLDRHLTFYSA